MKIAIIGGGWIGCHLANKLRHVHEVALFEKNTSLFTQTSYNNQNRLHLGYHYARNHPTRTLCVDTFSRFLEDYGFLTTSIDLNLYCIPLQESLIDYQTYKQIFNIQESAEVPTSLSNLEGCILTRERYIDFAKAKEYFNRELSRLVVTRTVDANLLASIQNEYDVVIDATNQHMEVKKLVDSFYELTVSFLYKKVAQVPFGALTLVDGALFSIYPYCRDLFTLTDVEQTPIQSFGNIAQLEAYKKELADCVIDTRRLLSENKVNKYYPQFLQHFEYAGHYLSTKVKVQSKSADRTPITTIDGNLISCFTGKIQGIYIIEDFVQNEINNRT